MQKSIPLFLGLGALVLAGLWLAKPAEPLPADAAPAARTFELVVEHGALRSGPALIRVREGEDVTLVVVSDEADELHLHGYDLEAALMPGVPARLSFKAAHSGRFDYELHGAQRALGTLEVLPK